MIDLGWPRRGFLSLLGLEHPTSDKYTSPALLAEAGIDPRTGGAVAVTTKAEFSGKNKDTVKHLTTYYWRMMPNGDQLSQKLFDIALESKEVTTLAADGSPVKTPIVVPRAVWVLGRKLFDTADEGDASYEEAHGQSNVQALMRNLSRVLAAQGEINRQLREGKLPNVAKILDECAVHDAVGEKLVIVGQCAEGGFDFDVAHSPAHSANLPLTVPETVARALTGYGVNTLDDHQRLRPEISMSAADPKTGTLFTTEAQVSEGENPKVRTSIAPTSLFENKENRAIPCLTNVKWKSDGKGKATLAEINLLGEDLTDEHQLMRMRSLGVTNRILHDLRNRRYPKTISHLIEHDLQDLVYHFTPPPPLSEGGRMTMISVGGNNMEEIADGFGEVIGGNSKVIYHEGLNKKGKSDRVGVIIDLGLHLSPKDEADVSAAPDVVEHLKHCNDILITHRHLDHTDGLFVYIQHGFLKKKTVYATPEVIRSIRDKIRSYPSIHPDDLPTFVPLKGEGWIHIKDKDGKTRLSVDYARNATPHSARCTPFCVHAHYEGKWLGSYLNHGDARYGSHNADDYKGTPVDADHLNKDFFANSNRRLLKEVPGLDPSIAERGPTYFDMDITSILRKGWAPTEQEVEENLVKLAYCFRDKGILLGMISTNDNRFETALRVATRSHRDLTEFGANLKKSATTANVLGVNDLRHEPEPRNNIQLYLDMCFEQWLTQKIAKQRQELEATGSEEEKQNLQVKISRNEARLEAFGKLKAISGASHRYKARKKLEEALQERFGREATLGSLEVAAPEDFIAAFRQLKTITNDAEREAARKKLEAELKERFGDKVTFYTLQAAQFELEEWRLGSVRADRTSATSRHIMSMYDADNVLNTDGRRLALLTGTQGTNVEVDAALSALAEGRHSVLDGNPKNSHTARPVVPENNVVIISQTAIPGNEAKQMELVRKLVSRGFTVVQAVNDGFRIYNLDDVHRERIIHEMGALHKEITTEKDGSLLVSGMPIHASGHGFEQDCRAWAKLVKADVTAAQHTSDPAGGQRLADICHAEGLRVMDRVVPNFEGIDIKAGQSPATTQITSVGRTLASLIRVQIVRQQRQYHSGHLIAQRYVDQGGAGGFRSDGLLATACEGGAYITDIAAVDAEEAIKRSKARNPGRPEPVEQNRTPPIEERPDRGAMLPGSEHRHRLLGRGGQRPQTAAFAGR